MDIERSTPTTLPDDVAREILVRLDVGDVATLFRCATACKGWRRLVAEPSFLRRLSWWPLSLVGFFSQRCLVDTRIPVTIRPDAHTKLAFVPLPGLSPLGTRRRPLSSLVPAGDATALVDHSMPLDSRGGLLVVRLCPHSEDMMSNIVRLAVCNLLAGTWDFLPVLDCNTQFGYFPYPYRCDIVPSNDAGDSLRPATGFKVLLIGKDKEKPQFNLHSIASGEASWRAPIKCFDTMEHQIWFIQHRKAVMCRGYAHWLFESLSNEYHVFSYNLKTEGISLTKLLSPTKNFPVHMTENCRLTTTAGRTVLSLRVYRAGQLEIWTPGQDSCDGAAKWERKRVTDHRLTELMKQLEQPYCIWEAERSDTLLIADYKVRRFYKAYPDNGTLEEVTNLFPDHHRGSILPMEIDWPTFFMLRLGGPS